MSLRLIIGNRTYSSWSLRGWLAAKQSGLPLSLEMVLFDTPDWDAARADPTRLPSAMVPTLWDGDVPVWESTGIIDYLAAKVGLDRYWPTEPRARALAMSIAAEMHAGFRALRQECPMNLRKRWTSHAVSADCLRNVARIETIWRQARALSDGQGPYLFGAFGAADIMYAPVVFRLTCYNLPIADDTRAYCQAMSAHPWIAEWVDLARGEPWVVRMDEVDTPASEVLW